MFAYVDEDVLLSYPTVTAFLALTDNYIDQSGIEETETEEETEEINHFLDLVIETDVMKEAHRFLREKCKLQFTSKPFLHGFYDVKSNISSALDAIYGRTLQELTQGNLVLALSSFEELQSALRFVRVRTRFHWGF